MEESSCVNVELCRSDTTEELETPQSLISALIELQLIKSLFHILSPPEEEPIHHRLFYREHYFTSLVLMCSHSSVLVSELCSPSLSRREETEVRG